ncbi:benzoylformate decarboxylase [Novosphingobium hassiacum]|uniref:Benzoylformate decarboxylase n=1 Tax=Novosphingobium hassiacum TaxID=173676 RepID=A0A7W5ZVR6_9SPHN|nr:benzoylformate decarboxylase [Novosphingobium hassiacum]MBB3858780.1 benzoylformate decarboxylase [Novosphingobium hassiacum]
MPTVREVSIGLLRELGMTTVFGNPGSTELPMFRDFPSDFRYVMGLQESVVLGIADGFAQGTRRAALVNLHSSAGVGHALGNLFTAFKNQTPLVVTAGQQARSILSYEPFLFAERAAEFPRPFVKWACEPARAEDVPAALHRAWLVAMEPPCGPTFVSIPIDDWDRECAPFEPRVVHAGRAPEGGAIATCGEALVSARAPAIVVGAGAARDGAWDQVIALAERHNAPVFVAPMSARCSFPEDHRLFAGFLTAGREAIVATLQPHDFVLALGGPMSLYHVEGHGPHVPPGCDMWLIGDNHVHAAWAPAGTAIVARCDIALDLLLQGPPPVSRDAPAARAPLPRLDGGAMTDAYVLQQIAALRSPDSIIVEEAPSSRGPMHDRLPILRKDTFYTTASGGLGHGLPAAVGMALARRGEKVIAILGDGSSMYAIQGLHAAVQHGLAVSFIIIKNNRYEALHHFGQHFGMQQLVGTQFPELDFCKLAEGHGMSARRADDAANLDAALRWSLAADGPTLVEANVL